MSVYVGIDGGGTQARAVVVDAEGHELSRVTGGAGIVDARAPDRAADAMAELTMRALEAAGAASPAAVLCCALAGAGRQAQRDAVGNALLARRVARDVIVVGDAEAAMYDAFGGGDGVLLIAGTGSIAWARHGKNVVRVGGWGMLLGDEGSAYDIGMRSLRAVARAHDGRAVETALTAAVLEHCGLREPTDLIAWTSNASKADVAALAPLTLAAATAEDAIALHIREQAVTQLALLVVTATQRVHLTAARVVTMGGVLQDDEMQKLLHTRIRALSHDATILERTVDAARGAAQLALQAPPRA